MENYVALDSDFLNFLLDSEKVMTANNVESAKSFFKSIFISLDLKPILHKFLYEQELLTNELVKDLVKDNFIRLISYDDFIKNERLFFVEFRDFYKSMNGVAFSESDESIFDFCQAHKNLGEIHTVLMAKELKIPCFFSNDHGAKFLARKINTAAYTLEVFNLIEVFKKVDATGKKLDSKKVRALTKIWNERRKKNLCV